MSKIGRRRNKENGGKKTIKLTVNIEDKYMDVINKLVASYFRHLMPCPYTL